MARDRLIGATVQNREGQIIGDIEDLIVGANNQIQGVIIGTGGFFGAGEKKIGVFYAALQFTQKDGRSVIVLPAASKDVLASVEPFKWAEPQKTRIERARLKAQELYERSKEQAGPAYEKAKEAAGRAYETTKDAAGKAYEKAKEAVKPGETK